MKPLDQEPSKKLATLQGKNQLELLYPFCRSVEGEWSAQEIGAKVVLLESWDVQQIASSIGLCVQTTMTPNMEGDSHQLLNIHFPFLASLFLYNNHIESIEQMCRISIPQLETLSICSHRVMQPRTRSSGYRPWARCAAPNSNPWP